MTRPFYRLIIFNIACFAAVVWGWKLGYVQFVFANDASHMTYVIAAVFLATLALTVKRAANGLSVAALDQWREHIATLGLIGSLLGFVIALQGVGANADAEVAAQLLRGMGVAFMASLVSVICALWTALNKQILEG